MAERVNSGLGETLEDGLRLRYIKIVQNNSNPYNKAGLIRELEGFYEELKNKEKSGKFTMMERLFMYELVANLNAIKKNNQENHSGGSRKSRRSSRKSVRKSSRRSSRK